MTSESDRREYFRLQCILASNLAAKFLERAEPVDVAGAMIGTGVDVLVNGLGKTAAVAYLRDLATELEADAPRVN